MLRAGVLVVVVVPAKVGAAVCVVVVVVVVGLLKITYNSCDTPEEVSVIPAVGAVLVVILPPRMMMIPIMLF